MPSVEAPGAAGATTEEALAFFDALRAVELDFMAGAWAGEGFPSGHPLDGVLEACHWHGKRFDSADEVHPLVFRGPGGTKINVNPAWVGPGIPLAMRLPLLKARPVGRLVQALLPLLATRRSRARLRMTRHRGCLTATMVYDSVPILDVFRQIDRDTVLGLMDLKGMEQPFFFVLRRERPG
ncbi:DUF4334 domain-containing protein [Ramlibacter tataouinensis]|uniref:DUF4334 domain-containing protein n=1 Tax=Ramlibacter tataouinensis (strain ATCC BAA-407 / DSM 14655 / LMG 21543 / TTB310) TaxID=365046 RepID=F5XWW1_RAMTT|nr:DUF4334 domain-containing protein [Ramlibacter tataouinensis]AEG91722.1 Conserved hypothetical protein [Ramlibacter tataouinensis TTB310]